MHFGDTGDRGEVAANLFDVDPGGYGVKRQGDRVAQQPPSVMLGSLRIALLAQRLDRSALLPK